MKIRIALFLIRALALTSRFVLVLYLAKYFDLQHMAQFGVVSAVIFLASYIIGMEGGSYAAREIGLKGNGQCNSSINTVLYILILMSCLTLPILYFIEHIFLSERSFLLLLMVFMEAYCTENRKILNIMEKPLLSSIIDLLKSAAWILPLMFYADKESMSLEYIIKFWALGLLVSTIIMYKNFRKIYSLNKFYFQNIKEALNKGKLILTYGFYLIFCETSAKIILKIKGSDADLAAYTIFSGFIFAIPVFVWSVTLAIDGRKIVESVTKGNSKFNSANLDNLKKGLFFCMLFSGGSLLVLKMYLNFVSRTEYDEKIHEYYIMIFLPFVHVIMTNVWNYLHIKKEDGCIAIATIISFLLHLICYLCLEKVKMSDVILITGLSYLLTTFLSIFFGWYKFKFYLKN
jgi:hypothetical protein